MRLIKKIKMHFDYYTIKSVLYDKYFSSFLKIRRYSGYFTKRAIRDVKYELVEQPAAIIIYPDLIEEQTVKFITLNTEDNFGQQLFFRNSKIGKIKHGFQFAETFMSILRTVDLVCRQNSGVNNVQLFDNIGNRILEEHSLLNLKSIESVEFHGNKNVEILDLWFANNYLLRFRINVIATPGSEIAAFKCFQLLGDGTVCLFDDKPVADGSIHFVDVELRNQFSPLILTCVGLDGSMSAMAFIPFPSLARCGAHYGELLAIDMQSGDQYPVIQTLRSYSDCLIKTISDANYDSTPKKIILDATNSTGAERIFEKDTLSWLKNLGLSISLAQTEDAPISDRLRYINKLIENDVSQDKCLDSPHVTLQMLADSIPTLQSVFEHPNQSCKVTYGSFILCGNDDGKPVSVVIPPSAIANESMYEILEQFPLFLQEAKQNSVSSSFRKEKLLSIRYLDLQGWSDEKFYAPVPLDLGLSSSKFLSLQQHAVTIILNGIVDFAILEITLETLCLQQGNNIFNVIIITLAENVMDLERVKSRYNFKEFNFIVSESRMKIDYYLKLAASSVEHGLILFVTDHCLFHNPNSVLGLAELAIDPMVISVSPILVGSFRIGKTTKKGILSSGSVQESRANQPQTHSICPFGLIAKLPPSVWPVAAGNTTVFMVRATDWNEYGSFGFDPTNTHRLTTPFWSNTTASGRIHVVTSKLSISLPDSNELTAMPEVSQEAGAFPLISDSMKTSTQVVMLAS